MPVTIHYPSRYFLIHDNACSGRCIKSANYTQRRLLNPNAEHSYQSQCTYSQEDRFSTKTPPVALDLISL